MRKTLYKGIGLTLGLVLLLTPLSVAHASPFNMWVLVVAGGASGSSDGQSGGGAGGYRENASFSVASGSYSVTVGSGTVDADGVAGNNSIFSSLTATGGGTGGAITTNGVGGGSGGGGGRNANTTGGAGTSGQGNNGGGGSTGNNSGGGGGGAGSAGTLGNEGGDGRGGDGGAGTSSSISGSSVCRGGGGAGAGGFGYGTVSCGGTTGSVFPYAEKPNTGGGGAANGSGRNGQSGVVIIRYTTSALSGFSVTGGTITTSGSDTIHTFTSNGTFLVERSISSGAVMAMGMAF